MLVADDSDILLLSHVLSKSNSLENEMGYHRTLIGTLNPPNASPETRPFCEPVPAFLTLSNALIPESEIHQIHPLGTNIMECRLEGWGTLQRQLEHLRPESICWVGVRVRHDFIHGCIALIHPTE